MAPVPSESFHDFMQRIHESGDAPKKISAGEHAIYRSDFEAHDTDRNGSLDRDEVRSLIRFQFARDPNEEELENFVSVFDRNGDGRIELCEYLDKLLGVGWTITEEKPEDPQRREHEMEIKESIETLGESHEDTVDLKYSFAVFESLQGNYDAALALLEGYPGERPENTLMWWLESVWDDEDLATLREMKPEEFVRIMGEPTGPEGDYRNPNPNPNPNPNHGGTHGT